MSAGTAWGVAGLVLLAACSTGDDSRAVLAPTTSSAGIAASTPASPPTQIGPDEPDTVQAVSSEPRPSETPIPPEPVSVLPEGFSVATVRITTADGETCEVCMWLADDSGERSRGLMEVTDLGDAAGMAFQFSRLQTGGFYMFNTSMPLSIAFFARGGDHLASLDMEPCPSSDSSTCERYRPGDSYLLAIETMQGGLEELGIGPGSRAEVLRASESPTCADID